MFQVLYAVTKEHVGKEVFQAFFFDEDKAMEFAKSEAKKLQKDFALDEHSFYDGSYRKTWATQEGYWGYPIWKIQFDNYYWLSDWYIFDNWDDEYHKFICLHPYKMKFDNMEQVKDFCVATQKAACA